MAALAEGSLRAAVQRAVLDAAGTPVDAILARPEGVDPELGLVVAPDIHGLRPLFDDLCRRLATHGFAVCAVEPFARVPADERAALDLEGRMGRLHELRDEEIVGDLLAARWRLGTARAAVIGFCMGGAAALQAAASGGFDRSVSCYGLLRLRPPAAAPGRRDPLETAAQVCPTLAVLGGRDTWVPPEDVEALRAAWQGRTDCEIAVYPEGEHGFVHDPGRPAHRPDDAADAWRRALAFLLR